MISGEYLFAHPNVSKVIENITQICGTPTEENWPGVSKLTLYNEFIKGRVYSRSLKENILKK